MKIKTLTACHYILKGQKVYGWTPLAIRKNARNVEFINFNGDKKKGCLRQNRS